MAKLDSRAGIASATTGSNSSGTTNDISSYLTSGTAAGLRGDIAIHAPPAFGKSFLAATASKAWPGAELGQKAVALDDVIWCAVDRGAVDGLLMSRVEIPYLIDVRGLCEDFGAGKGTEHANSLVRQVMAERGSDIRVVVWDTISELDKVWQVGLDAEGGADDSTWLYRKLLARHRSHYNAAHKAAGKARILWLAHSVALSEARKDAPKSFEASRRATRLPGGAEIKLDATGQGHHLYINNASLVGTILLEEQKGKAPVRWLSSGGTQFETKNRLQGLIGEREPFDLQAVFSRVDTRLAEIRAELAKGT